MSASGSATPPFRLPALVTVAAVVTTAATLQASGGLEWAGPARHGALVRYGLPLTQTATQVMAAVTIGLLLVVAFLAPDRSRDRWALTGTRLHAAVWAGYCGFVWFLFALAVLLLSVGEQTGTSIGSPDALMQLSFFVQNVVLGRILTLSMLLALLASQLALSARRTSTVGWAFLVAVAALVPPSLNGHSSGADDHVNSVNSLLVHSLSAAIWVGGLIGLVMLSPYLRQPLEAARRFSPVATVCFVLLGLSGLDSAWLRLGSWNAMFSPYGALLAGKAALLVILGAVAWWHRRRMLAAERADPRRTMLRIAAVEVGLMAVAIGLAGAVSRSVPPVAEAPSSSDPDYAFTALVGFERPPEMSWATIFTQWFPDRMLIMLCAGLIIGYALGVRKLRTRGDAWPWWRTVLWVAGCLLLLWVTSGGPVKYGMIAFSGHMIMHMLLMMAVPPLLVAGSPVTLALRAVPARRDASAGAREWLLSIAHSRVLAVLAHPVVAAVLFSGGLVVFYFTPLFPLAMSTHTGHMLMTFHFLASGYLFCWVLIGSDPGPPKAAYPIRLIIVMATMAVHAFVAVTLMTGEVLLAPDWWPQLGLTDAEALLEDQRRGAMIAWAVGDGPTLLLMLAVTISWSRSSGREARRYDRQAERDDDAQLAAYNAYLSALGSRKAPPS
ncbi:cytochrome c oxidase assembly protein [Kineosporia babensis]|uniref:Bifunctional copper resistance protein CopD/cytochrome c oxidase assembly protein n=1 Tax=Kineosporia babensis TaxID=499548 RepID=A0A9X1NLW2_9ACTN|nr:cytochrome c oxidase assembly protein [Kineosporia babensis]MCD5316184.1 bifunctional copper resistance protein CopD/cytochrome c oxidase assembly protein [Kineosporia babensis]